MSIRRVLLVAPLPPPRGGVATWAEALIEHGLPDDWTVDIVNSRVARRHWADRGHLNSEVYRSLRNIWDVWRRLRTRSYDVLHVCMYLSKYGTVRDCLYLLLARAYRIPLVLHIRADLSKASATGLSGRLLWWLLRNADYVIVLNSKSLDVLRTIRPAPGKTSVVPNFVSPATSDLVPVDRSRSRRMRVVFVGGIVEAKGIRTLLEVAKRHRSVHYTIVGTGPDAVVQWLKQEIATSGLAGTVRLTGELPHDEVLRILMESDVLLFPSHSEGFPNVVIEAMVAGLAIVASNVGAIPEMVDVPYGGYLFDYDDVDGFADAISQLANDPDRPRQMGTYNRNRALRDYSYEHVTEVLVDIYDQLARG